MNLFWGSDRQPILSLVDVAATFRLPWSWPLGESPWSVETRLITSAGALSAAEDTGLIATVVPQCGLKRLERVGHRLMWG